MARSIFTLVCLLFFSLALIKPVNATHLLGGELTYQSDTTASANPLRYYFKLRTYHDANSAADEPSATLYLGDGVTVTSERANKVIISNSCGAIFLSTYYFEYTFPGPGQYRAVYLSPNRTNNIVNLTNSDEQAFTIAATFTIDAFDAIKRPHSFLTIPIPCALQNQTFRHSLATYDLDGDSLVYELITPLKGIPAGDKDIRLIDNVKGYTLPPQVSINAKTGEFIWDKPAQAGRYSFAVRANTYRNKILVGNIMRDFVVTVVPNPDTFTHSISIENRSELSINDENQIFLTAGQPIKIKVKYQTTGQAKNLEAYSELFFKSATIPMDTIATQDGILAEITLNPAESWRRSQPYVLVLRGVSEVNGVLLQQDFTLTLVATPPLVSGGIGESESGTNGLFTAYPNPARDFVWVKNKREVPRVQYRLYNALQQIILQTKLNTGNTRIKLPPVATGIYFYQILADNGKVLQSGKILIE